MQQPLITETMSPTPPGGSTKRSRWRTLPADILKQSCHRVSIMTLVVAALWAVPLVMNNLVAPLVGHTHTAMMRMQWISPGNQISAIGLAASFLMLVLIRQLRGRPQALLDASLGFEIVTAALLATLMHWYPTIESGGISWLCLIILTFPVIVPSTPWKTFWVSLIVATMDPIAIWISALRGMTINADAFLLIWYFLPNYIAVALAMIPAHIIGGLGREVRRARELGAYQLGDLLGRGGMGEVYLAQHRMLARPAAIKLIRPETLGAGSSNGAEVAIRRFRREAQAAALLKSPHTVDLYDFGVTDDGTFYYVMELLEGSDLESLVNRFGPLPPERAVHLLRHACHSLSEAHARGLIHRDIKPSNIFTCRLGLSVDYGKVLDFGLVKHRETAEESPSVLLTQPGSTTGTPAFMAPELALGEQSIDGRVDIYALGCVAFWLLTGRLVFEADTPVRMMLQHIQAEPPPPSRSSELDIPPELDRVVIACLSKKPEDRPADAAALAEMLAACELPQPWTEVRAAQWWDAHLPASAPFTDLHEKTPMAVLQASS
jgi:eukaryotic-like serine/threonine-protein kinase